MNAIVLLVSLFGLFECMWGYRLFNIILRIFGFGVGATIGASLGLGFSDGNPFVALFAGLLGGIFIAAIIVLLRKLGIFLIGAFLGVLVGFLLAAAGLKSLTVSVILAVAGGVLAIVIDKLMIILSTAIGGAWLTIFGVSSIFIGNTDMMQNILFGSQKGGMGALFIVLVMLWIGLSAVGILVQYEKIPLQKFMMERLPIEQLQKKWGSKKEARFKLTKQSLDKLKNENLPDTILEGLRTIENQEFFSEREFLDALEQHIEKEQIIQHQELILKYAQQDKSEHRSFRLS